MSYIPTLKSATLVAGAAAVFLTGCSEQHAHVISPTTVYFTELGVTQTSQVRDFTGTVHSHVESEISFRTGGKLIRRLAEVGDHVKAGQIIAVLDPEDYALGVAAADAQARQAKAQAKLDSSDQARFGRLTKDGSIAAADHERQTYKSEASDAKLDEAQRQLQLAKNLSSYTTLVAPYDGVVTGVIADVGQVVAQGQPVVSMARDGAREIFVDVPEGMISQVRNFIARARPWDGGDAHVDLKLQEISPLATAQGRMFRVKYSEATHGSAVLNTWPLGSTAEVALQYPARSSIVLPISAIVNSGHSTIVWSVDSQSQKLVALPVKITQSGAESVSVEGIPEHSKVVTVGAQKLDAGMKINAIERKPDEAMKVARSAT